MKIQNPNTRRVTRVTVSYSTDTPAGTIFDNLNLQGGLTINTFEIDRLNVAETIHWQWTRKMGVAQAQRELKDKMNTLPEQVARVK